MKRKPRILLVPDIAWWVIGEMGKQIVARFSSKYDFYFLPATLLSRRPDLVREAVSAVDLVHCINDDGTVELFQGLDSATLPPLITWIHHVTTWAPHQQLAVDRSAALIACTSGWKEYLDKRVQGRLPVTVVPHGVDTEFFRPRPISVGRFGIPKGKFVVGFLGSKGSDQDYGRKGTGVLLEVIRRAAEELPDLHLLIAGPGWDKEVADLKALGISVSYTGYVRKADVPVLYSAMDVYLLTSRVEGGPCTVFEAMACETAVVSTRVGVVPELISDGVNGFSADVDNVEGLLQAVVALGKSPKLRIAIAKRGRATVAQRSWAEALSPLEDVYDSFLGSMPERSTPLPTPAWMEDPQRLLRATCAADALITVYHRLRKGSMKPGRGLRMIHEMLREQSVLDVIRGASMIKRYKSELV